MSQSRSLSALEAVTNIAVGWLVAYATQLVVFPAVGLQATLAQNLTVRSVVTGASPVRGHLLRRHFVRLAAWRT